MARWLIGYVALCVVAFVGALLAIWAAGGMGSLGLYGKLALAIGVVIVVIAGMVLMVLALARGGSPGGAGGRDPAGRETPPETRRGGGESDVD